MTTIAVPREASGQRLVAATPATVAKLVRLGYDVLVEAGAGDAATFSDEAYADAGAKIVDVRVRTDEAPPVEPGAVRLDEEGEIAPDDGFGDELDF